MFYPRSRIVRIHFDIPLFRGLHMQPAVNISEREIPFTGYRRINNKLVLYPVLRSIYLLVLHYTNV